MPRYVRPSVATRELGDIAHISTQQEAILGAFSTQMVPNTVQTPFVPARPL